MAPGWDDKAIGEGLFFIVGTGRSGTTLLQRMLCAHPRLFIPPETQFFARFDPAVVHGVDPVLPADEAAYARRVAEHPWFKALGLSEAALRDALGGGVRDARGLFLWMLRSLSAGHEGQRLGEKSPLHERSLDRINEVFPYAKFVHIHRDPRDVAASLRNEAWAHEQSAQRLGRHIAKVLERQQRAAARFGPRRYLTMSYEALVGDPDAELRRLCAFLGEAFDPAMLRYHERAETGFLEAERGWKELATKRLDASRTGRYRELLSARETRAVERAVGGLMGAYGYALDRELPRDRMAWRVGDLVERMAWAVRRQSRSVRKRINADAARGARAT